MIIFPVAVSVRRVTGLGIEVWALLADVSRGVRACVRACMHACVRERVSAYQRS